MKLEFISERVEKNMWIKVHKELAIEMIKKHLPFTVVDESLICLIDLELTEMYTDDFKRIIYKASLKSLRISKRKKDDMIKNWHNRQQRTLQDYKSFL